MEFDDYQDAAETPEPEDFWSPISYLAELHRLLDGALATFSCPQQLVYMQLYRESFGRGSGQVAMTLSQLQQKTGMSKSTIIKALEALRLSEQIAILESGGPKVPAQYKVHPLVSAKSPGPTRPSIETRLAELDDEDRSLLLSLERGLTPSERSQIEEIILSEFREMGFTPDSLTMKQALHYHLLKTQMYHRIRGKYPAFFKRS